MEKREQTFEHIYSRNYQQVYSFLHKLCQAPDTAEQLTKQTFLRAYKEILKYTCQYELITWLLGISAEEYLKHLRNGAEDSFKVNFYITDPEAPLTEEPGYRLTEDVDISEIKRVLNSLPLKDTKVLLLRIYAEVSYKEIAGLLNISKASAKLIFLRTKEKVKEELFHE